MRFVRPILITTTLLATLLPVLAGQAQPDKFTPFPPFKKDGPLGLGLKKGGPKVGEPAPDFELKFLDDKKTFKLSDNFDKRPTVLIFHSFT